jgi:AcrR family transcriptional regulator
MTLEHAAVREALIKSTLALMQEGGLAAVKARTVADQAGVSVGTVYNLFGNVDQLILAANLKIYEDLGALGAKRMVAIEADLQKRIKSGKLADTARERLHARLLGLAETYVDFISANANRWSALLAFNRTRAVGESQDNLQHLNALIDILGDVLKEAPRWRTPAERRLAGRALWSAVHGIVVTSYFGDDKPARQRTMALLELLLATIADGAFAAPAI